MRTAFFGTPEIALPALTALHETTEVVGVVCQPDRPRGRGMKLSPCPVKQRAQELGLEVHQPIKVKTGTLDAWLKDRDVQAAVVLAYGRILPKAVLTAPPFGCVNLHASLLPKYRGAAPIQWALMNGELETGISLMKMDEGLDTGPVYLERTLAISPGTTAGDLAARLADLAAEVVRNDLPEVFGGLEPTPQDEKLATHAPPIEARHCALDWTRPAAALANQIMGLSPKPGAVTTLAGKRLKILRAEATAPAGGERQPGSIVLAQGTDLIVATGGGLLRIIEAQLPGKRALPARDLVNGRAFAAGMILGADN